MLLHKEITDIIIQVFFKVYNELGYGFLEKVYENSLMLELRKRGLEVSQQHPIKIFYDTTNVGNYFADILVASEVIVEIKASEKIIKAHHNQIVNYLRASNIKVGLLLNFGEKPEFKRVVFTRKKVEMQ